MVLFEVFVRPYRFEPFVGNEKEHHLLSVIGVRYALFEFRRLQKNEIIALPTHGTQRLFKRIHSHRFETVVQQKDELHIEYHQKPQSQTNHSDLLFDAQYHYGERHLLRRIVQFTEIEKIQRRSRFISQTKGYAENDSREITV